MEADLNRVNNEGFTPFAFATVKTLKKMFLQYGIVTRHSITDDQIIPMVRSCALKDNNLLLQDQTIKFCTNKCFKRKICHFRPTKRFECKKPDAKFTYLPVEHNQIAVSKMIKVEEEEEEDKISIHSEESDPEPERFKSYIVKNFNEFKDEVIDYTEAHRLLTKFDLRKSIKEVIREMSTNPL